MTNYLFRGKRADGQGWVEGFYYQRKPLNESRYLIEPIGQEKGIAQFIIVDPETVGQVYATGLPRLPKIAIGDLVKVQGTKRNGIYTTEIVHSINGGYTLKENKTYLNNDFIIPAVLEIIGNKWDNPELLTKTQ